MNITLTLATMTTTTTLLPKPKSFFTPVLALQKLQVTNAKKWSII
jgi:hypothetical protein